EIATPSVLIQSPLKPLEGGGALAIGPPERGGPPMPWQPARARATATAPAARNLPAFIMPIVLFRYDFVFNRRFYGRMQGCAAAAGEGKRSTNKNVAELPGVVLVDVLGEQSRPAFERRPVGVVAPDRAEIGRLHLKAAAIVHLVGVDDARPRVLQRPH